MDSLPVLLVITFASFLATMVGGLFALRFRDRLHLILGFSAGAVIGVAFFDLMPEALELSGTADPSFVFGLVALGFTIYLILDRMILLHGHDDEHAHGRRGIFGASSLSFHGFLDGMSIGFAFQVSAALGIVVALAVMAHKFSDGINTVSMIVKSAGTRAQALRWLFVGSCAPVAGVIATFFVSIPAQALGLLLAIFAGFFFYMGASDLLPESHHNHPVRWTTISTVLGIAVMYLVIRLAGV